MSPRRFLAIVRKELLHIIRDPRNLFLVIVSPAFLLFLLSYIFAFDASQVSLAVLDLDSTPSSREYIASLTSTSEIKQTSTAAQYQDILPLLVSGQADAVLVIPPGFASSAFSSRPVHVQAIVDGADPFAGSQTMSILAARSGAFVAGSNKMNPGTMRQRLQIRSQAWYNAGLESSLSMVPGLLAIVLVMPTMALALALTREKESGTLEGLVATPITGSEYLLGKLMAYITMGLVSALLALLVAVVWFEVPFRGNLALYMLLTAIYLLACMGAAVFIANFVRSQQTAMFIVLILFIVPSFFLAGLITPISTQLSSAALTSYAMPSTHFVLISRVAFLKGLGLPIVAHPALILLAMGTGALALGLALFRKKVA